MQHDLKGFSETDVRWAAAIVKTFETGRPAGDPTAVAVLDDGAGVSYGISQFTHRSGSLGAVVERYLAAGGVVGGCVLEHRLEVLRQRTAPAIAQLARDASFKKALAAAGVTREMREAQDAVAFDLYMRPAIAACAGSGFRLPLSLAVVHDSITHGSYNKIRDRVRVDAAGPEDFEKAWITEYVRRRDAWLASIPRLRATRYRTRFFLNRIALGRWEAALPLRVHGRLITASDLGITPEGEADSAAGPDSHTPHNQTQTTAKYLYQPAPTPQARPPITLEAIEQRVEHALDGFDRIERMGLAIANRTDRAKSLWTTVAGAVWQTGWAVFGVLAGLPREVWFFVAGATAALTLLYLYRQIALGRIREMTERNTDVYERP